MTNHRSDSQPKPSEPAKVVRLVDAKSARKEASPPDNGVRPTKEGPWDPCRFQEYEISPEFRKQIMMAKPPPVDPKLFMETFPPTTAAALLGTEESGDPGQTVAFNPADFQGMPPVEGLPDSMGSTPSTAETVPFSPVAPLEAKPTRSEQQRKSARKVQILIFAGALLGLVVGWLATRNKRQHSEPIAETVVMSAASADINVSKPKPSNTLNAAPQQVTTVASIDVPKPKVESTPSTEAVGSSPKAPAAARAQAPHAFAKKTHNSAVGNESDPVWVDPK